MPRRIPDYALQFADFNMIASIGAAVFGLAQLLFLWNMIASYWKGKKVTENRPWEGAVGLEWTVPCPAPHHTFATPPVVKDEELQC